jgi:hypothetical protein
MPVECDGWNRDAEEFEFRSAEKNLCLIHSKHLHENLKSEVKRFKIPNNLNTLSDQPNAKKLSGNRQIIFVQTEKFQRDTFPSKLLDGELGYRSNKRLNLQLLL